MKKQILLGLCFTLSFWVQVAHAQTVGRTYNFSEGNLPYNRVTGGTVVSTDGDDDILYDNIPIGFPFVYNGRPHTSVTLGSNGFVALHSGHGRTFSGYGTSIATPGGSALYEYRDTTGGYNSGPLIAGMNADLLMDDSNSTAQLSYQTSGAAGSRRFIVQYDAICRYSYTGDVINFQIILSEADMSITVHYGTVTPASNSGTDIDICQVGLRGNDTTDVVGRTAGLDWSTTTASSTARQGIVFGAGMNLPSGLFFKWTPGPPAVNDIAINNILKPLPPSNTLCVNSVTDSVKVSIVNYGSDSITRADLTYQLGTNPPVQQTFTFSSPVRTFGTRVVTFSTPVTISGSAPQSLVVYATQAAQSTSALPNDTIKRTFSVSAAAGASSPYPSWDSDFDGPLQGTPYNWVHQQVSGTTRWVVDSAIFDPGNSLSIPFAANVGPKFLFFNSFPTASNGSQSRMSTPCLNLGNWPANEPVILAFGMNEDSDYPNRRDSVLVEVAVDGYIFSRVAGFGRHNATVTRHQWVQRTVDLSAFRGQTIRIGLTGKSGGGNNLGLDYVKLANTVPTSLPNLFPGEVLSMWPNPAKDVLQVRVHHAYTGTTAVVFNTLGQQLMTFQNLQEENSVSLSELKPGAYILKLAGNTYRFVKQ